MTDASSTDQPTATARVTITVTAPPRDAAHHARTIADHLRAEYGDTMRLDIHIDGAAATEATGASDLPALAITRDAATALRDTLTHALGEDGYCPHCGRGDCAPTADQYEQMRQRALATETALAALHAGEEPCPDPLIELTPAQWLWQWNRATPEQRLDMIGRVQQAFADQTACHFGAHRAQVERARRDGAAVGRVRAELDRWMRNTLGPQTGRALSDLLAALDGKEATP